MPAADPFPLVYPGDVRPGFTNESALRRIAGYCEIANGSRVLTLGFGGGAAPAFFARQLGASVVTADASDEAIQKQRERLRESGADGVVVVRRVDFSKLPFGEGEFDAIVLDAFAPMRLEAAARDLRRHLAPNGKLCAAYPVRVARHPSPAVLKLWEDRLGEPLLLPRELLQLLERFEYEPIATEVLDDVALGTFYKQIEGAVGGDQGSEKLAMLRDEIALFRSQAGRSATSFALVAGRRREPGEKPAPSRNE